MREIEKKTQRDNDKSFYANHKKANLNKNTRGDGQRWTLDFVPNISSQINYRVISGWTSFRLMFLIFLFLLHHFYLFVFFDVDLKNVNNKEVRLRVQRDCVTWRDVECHLNSKELEIIFFRRKGRFFFVIEFWLKLGSSEIWINVWK